MNKPIAVYLVDAFTKKIGKGNRAGVVLDANGLSESQMQEISHRVNVSETAFVLPATDASHDLWVRYFTPTNEVPICGHATIATHYLRANHLGLPSGRVICKTGAGILPVDIVKTNDDYTVVMTQAAPKLFDPASAAVREKLLKALGISEYDLDPSLPVQEVSTGHSKMMIPLRRKETLDSLNPDLAALKKLSADIHCNGFFTFTLDSQSPEHFLAGRMFAPAIGIAEDPVTGNANGPAGFYLYKHGKLPPDREPISYRAKQGEAMGKAGDVDVLIYAKESPIRIQIKGTAVVVGRH